MGLFKKYPVFCAVIIVLLLVAAGGAYLAFAESSKVTKARNQVDNAESQLNNLLHANPAPSEENVEASRANVEALRSELAVIRENLQRGSRLTTSEDGVRVMAGIQQYISDYQSKTRNHVNEEGEPAPIRTPGNFAFGFDLYIDEATVPDNPEVIPVLDKQRQILAYVMDQLIAANPKSIAQVRREVLERKGQARQQGARPGQRQDSDPRSASFNINQAVSARVPGAIDTMAFQVTFTGYTSSLREFLNNLAPFEMPIVVRSVEVSRVAAADTREQDSRASARGRPADIFGGFGATGGEAAGPPAEAKRTEAQKPVISDNLSTFTVTLEFIEIILPSDSEENPS